MKSTEIALVCGFVLLVAGATGVSLHYAQALQTPEPEVSAETTQLVETNETIAMVSPVGAPQAVRVIVDSMGHCLWILTRDGNQRACEDQSDWKGLPTEVDKGQFFKGKVLD